MPVCNTQQTHKTKKQTHQQVQQATMVDSTPLIPDSSSTDDKQGHRVLGCCDSRTAVIVINSVFFSLSFLSFALLGAFTLSITGAIIFNCINILFYIIVIYSAVQFQYVGVIVGILWNVIIIILFIVNLVIVRMSHAIESEAATFIIVSVIFFLLLMIYAECVFVSEVGKGIMSRETHSREKYSW